MGAWFVLNMIGRTNKIFTGKNGNIFTRVSSLFLSSDKELVGESQGTVNVLLLGIGGAGHQGEHLTDTMIVASIDTKSNEVTLISIPRDFALELPKYGYNKVNAAYAYAFRDDPNTAGDAAIDVAEKITGLRIPYYAVIDFRGFVQAVNDLGGVDVTVDRSFTDATFPNDYPYDTTGYLAPVTFVKGPQHMDGKTALIFARSRHSEENNEGSDFARSERQKKILVAMKNKILQLNLTGLSTINNLLKDFTENFRTNLEPYELKRLADLAKQISSDNIYSFSLEPQDDLICAGLVDLQTHATTATKVAEPALSEEPTRMYVVEPCEGKTLTDIHEFLVKAPELAKLKKENADIEAQNSTSKTGLAATTFSKLSELGLTVNFTSFKGKVPYSQTILYDNSHGTKPKTLDYLKSHYNFTVSDVPYSGSFADFVIILGKDAL